MNDGLGGRCRAAAAALWLSVAAARGLATIKALIRGGEIKVKKRIRKKRKKIKKNKKRKKEIKCLKFL